MQSVARGRPGDGLQLVTGTWTRLDLRLDLQGRWWGLSAEVSNHVNGYKSVTSLAELSRTGSYESNLQYSRLGLRGR